MNSEVLGFISLSPTIELKFYTASVCPPERLSEYLCNSKIRSTPSDSSPSFLALSQETQYIHMIS